jgi:peptidyl-dipeptidase A
MLKDLEKFLVGIVLAISLTACSQQTSEEPEVAVPTETIGEFLARVNTEYKDWFRELNTARWLRATYIDKDSAFVESLAHERYTAWHSATVKEALRYEDQTLDSSSRRALNLLKLRTRMVAPDDDVKRKELAQILTGLGGMYSSGQYCRNDNDCLGLSELEDIIAQSRDYDELLEAWQGWRTISPSMREKYQRFVEISNEGAIEFGYGNLGDMWRSAYDMSSAEFATEVMRLWEQVKPLYEELHCHVRAKLGETYGEDKVPQDGPIPAHLLGNMWAQQWGFIFNLLEPYPGVPDLGVDGILKNKDYSPQEMVRLAENFYVSLGMNRLPDTFWERSMFSKPADRKVVCHASAWNLDGDSDLRIKMCIKQTYDELRTIYHELGHNYYQWAYSRQPMLFRDGANDGFHEAIGDTITLSMVPGYLAEAGLIGSAEESDQAVINHQMVQALDKIAFLPFSKLVDEWRWGVFSGKIAQEDYNKAWWGLREQYQGVAAPVERTEADFDPGAKYHVPGNVPYTRYFIAHVLQFQFQRALCEAAGYEGKLHECSVYGSKEAGARLQAMLETGASVPWQDTLEKLTDMRVMDATAIIDYFSPLMGYLKEQNQGRSCGW